MEPKRATTAIGKRNGKTNQKMGTSNTKRAKGTEAISTTPRGKGPLIQRPKTSHALATKQWRQANFHVGGPASRREVELLGEWLNSVLADNLDAHENPLDIVTNAQHWFSIAFNELVRQVAVTCAERGRLLAVIWKRNQDLFSKLIEVQRQERDYILQCHKDRVQFLKTDLEFANSRLQKIDEAYEEEQAKWKESREKDISKFDSLQQKIDQQVADRKVLQEEIQQLRQQLGLPPVVENDEETIELSLHSYSREELAGRVQKMKTRIRLSEQPDLRDCTKLMDNISHFLDSIGDDSFNIRQRYERLFQSLPESAQPTLRSLQWLNSILSYIYALFIHTISISDWRDTKKIDLVDFTYTCMLHFCGNRLQTEQILFDLLYTAKKFVDDGNSRALWFLRFFGFHDPLPRHALHFYLFCVSVIAKTGSSQVFPVAESNDEMIGGIPASVCSASSHKILSRFCQGRVLKFYTERIEKTANSGFLKFGGRAIAEYDSIMEYLVTAYLEETHKIEESIQEFFEKSPTKEIATYTEFYAAATLFRTKPHQTVLTEIMEKCMTDRGEYPIQYNTFVRICDQYGLTVPFELSRDDFDFEPSPEDLVPFAVEVFNIVQPEFDAIMAKLTENRDEILLKQLKSARVKFDQSLKGRSTVKIFENNVRELFEKIALMKVRLEL